MCLGGIVSRTLKATSGVPQGSHFEPLLFSLFINDLCDELVESEFLLYADDLKLYRKMTSLHDAAALQRDLDRVNNWCQRNAMQLNVAKCETITFTRRAVPDLVTVDYAITSQRLRRVNNVKDLGIHIDSRLTFKPQVNHVVSWGKSMLGFMKRLSRVFNCPHVTKSLYCSLVRPLLEYAAVV